MITHYRSGPCGTPTHTAGSFTSGVRKKEAAVEFSPGSRAASTVLRMALAGLATGASCTTAPRTSDTSFAETATSAMMHAVAHSAPLIYRHVGSRKPLVVGRVVITA